MRNPSSLSEPPILTRTAGHALRALLVLAQHGGERPLAAAVIAERSGTPANYLGKTLYALARAGLVRSMRGPTGGFALAIPAASITVARIADVFTEPTLPRQCLLGVGRCNPHTPCAAHHQWNRLASAAREPLVTTTLADLLAGA